MSLIENLVVMRHGSYGTDYRLTEGGKREVESSAKNIQLFLNVVNSGEWSEDDVVIISSEAVRARETAGIVAEVLGLAVIAECLAIGSEDRDGSDDEDRIRAELEEYIEGKKNVILVTHEYETILLPSVFGSVKWGVLGRGDYAWKACANAFDGQGDRYYITPSIVQKIDEDGSRESIE